MSAPLSSRTIVTCLVLAIFLLGGSTAMAEETKKPVEPKKEKQEPAKTAAETKDQKPTPATKTDPRCENKPAFDFSTLEDFFGDTTRRFSGTEATAPSAVTAKTAPVQWKTVAQPVTKTEEPKGRKESKSAKR